MPRTKYKTGPTKDLVYKLTDRDREILTAVSKEMRTVTYHDIGAAAAKLGIHEGHVRSVILKAVKKGFIKTDTIAIGAKRIKLRPLRPFTEVW